MRLDLFSAQNFDRGASRLKEAMWVFTSAIFVASWVPGSRWRVRILRLFGAQIGQGVVIKPKVAIKFPWKLSIGDWSWIGEDVWIDNLANVSVGSHACISQGVYLCTGSHDWKVETFDLIVRPITIGDAAWICAKSSIAPGTVVEEGAILSMGSFAKGTLAAWTIYAGHPASAQGDRRKPERSKRP